MIGMSMGLRLGARGGNRLAAYFSANGLRPQLAADFSGASGHEGYMVDGAASTFADLFPNFARSGNATMFDSDGLLKWAPHNLLTYSEAFDNAAWVKISSGTGSTPTVTANAATAPNGTLAAEQIVFDKGAGTGTGDYSGIEQNISGGGTKGLGVWMRTQTGTAQIALRANGDGSYDTKTVTAEWQFFSFAGSATTTGFQLILRGTYGTSDSATLLVWGAHLYRSDLGGMADNPDRNDSYVPTTSAAVYMPRRNAHVYDGSSWVNRGVLIESAARTNLVTYSADFTNAAWAKGGDCATLAVDATGPDGTTSAVTLIDNNTGGTGTNLNIVEDVTVATSTMYTLSVFAKKDQLSWLNLTIASFTTPGTSRAYFNLDTGVKGTIDAGFDGGATMTAVGNGWYRCSVSFTTDASDTSGQVYIACASADGNVGVDRDGTSSILIYGAQFEAAATPSSYIPTAGSTVTRAADSLPIPAANLPYDSSAMWMAMKGRMTYADTGAGSPVAFLDWEQAFNERILIDLRDNAGTGQIRFFQYDAASGADTVLSGGSVYSPGVNVPFSISSRHGSTYINGAVDGTALTEDTTPTALPDLSGTVLDLGFSFSGYIENFVMGSGDPGDTGIEEAST